MQLGRCMILVGLVACPSTDDGSSTPVDAATVELAGECAMADDHGGFSVQAAGELTGVEGKVADGVVPISVLEEIASAGDCRVLRRNNPYCDPACERGQTCDFDGTCLPYPANQDMGVATIEGLVQSVEMEPVFPGYTYFDTSLPDPPFEPGALITLTLPGQGSEPHVLHGVGVEPLGGLAPEWQVSEGRPLVVSWDPPTAEVARATVELSISIDQHGATPGVLRCSFEDDGEGTVEASVVDALVASGVTGFPTGSLVRRTADQAQVAGGGCMDFIVAAPSSVDVDVDGFTPCVNDGDCPEGQKCNIPLQICEDEG